MYASQYTNDEISAAIEVTESYGTYATAHVFKDEDINRGLDRVLKCIDHGFYMTEKTMRRIKEVGVFYSPNTTGFSPKIFEHPTYGDPTSAPYKKLKEAQEKGTDIFQMMRNVKPKVVFNSNFVFLSGVPLRQAVDYEKWFLADQIGNFEMLKAITSTAGELAALTGPRNPYPEGKLGVIDEGAYADIIIVEGNPLEDVAAFGADSGYWDAKPRGREIESIKLIMKDGKVYKNTL